MPIPKSQATAMHLPETPLSPQSVADWAIDLPYSNLSMLGRSTFAMLEQLATVSLTATDRLAVNRTAEKPVNVLLDHLQNLVVREHARADEFARLGAHLCQLMATSYETAARAAGSSRIGLLRRRFDAGARAIHFCGRAHLFQAMRYARPPVWAWDAALRIVRRSQASGQDRAAFLAVVAFRLADTGSLVPMQMVTVLEALQALPMADLAAVGVGASSEPTRAVFFYTDEGPGMGEVPAKGQSLDFTKLCTRVRAGKTDLPADLAERLATRWAVPEQPKGRRQAKEGRRSRIVVVGFQAAHAHLTAQRDDFEPTDLAAPTAFGELANFRGPRIAPVSARVIDLSRGGCRLGLPSRSGLRVGEAVAVDTGGSGWWVGAVAWLADQDGEVQCGLQWLLLDVSPTEVMFEARQPLAALTGRCAGSDGERPGKSLDALLYSTPRGAYRSIAWIKHQNEWHRTGLTIARQTGLVEVATTQPAASAEPVPAFEADADIWQQLSPYAGTAVAVPQETR